MTSAEPGLRRSRFLGGALAALAAGLLPRLAPADPLRPSYRFLIPANPGGGWDLTGRAIGQALIDSGQAAGCVFENRGGAAGTIGLAQFATDYRGDPHALMVMGSVMLGGIITGRPPVGLDQVRPIARLTNEYNVFVLPPDSPHGSMQDVLRQFRNDPRSVKWGGGSRGSTEHIAIHMLARAMGVPPARINYVPFRGGGEAAAAVMAGYVAVGGSGFSEFLPHISTGKMRAVAVTSPTRLAGTDAPTLRELGADVVIGNWRGLCAPAGLSADEVAALESSVARAMQSGAWQRTVRLNQWLPDPLVGEPFARFVTQEFETMRTVLNKAGMA